MSFNVSHILHRSPFDLASVNIMTSEGTDHEHAPC